MWTRAELKSRAKEVLRKSYWKALLVSMVIVAASGNMDNFKIKKHWNITEPSRVFLETESDYIGNFFLERTAYTGPWIWGFLIGVIASFLILWLFRVVIGYSFEVGGKRYFLKSTEDHFDLNNLTYAFNRSRIVDIVKTMVYRGVLIFLWSLLFLIPGIIKAYAYQMVPYILADNPNIGYQRAVELSKNMTEGEKWNIFVLDLSFIGWNILGSLLFGIGRLFVNPYVESTQAELYLVLRENALEKGICTREELLMDEFTK